MMQNIVNNIQIAQRMMNICNSLVSQFNLHFFHSRNLLFMFFLSRPFHACNTIWTTWRWATFTNRTKLTWAFSKLKRTYPRGSLAGKDDFWWWTFWHTTTLLLRKMQKKLLNLFRRDRWSQSGKFIFLFSFHFYCFCQIPPTIHQPEPNFRKQRRRRSSFARTVAWFRLSGSNELPCVFDFVER